MMVFYFFNHTIRYLDDKYKYFYVTNSLGNLALILWPMTNLIVFIRYNTKVKDRLKDLCVSCWRKVSQPMRRKLGLRLPSRKRNQSMPCVYKSDAEFETANLAEAEDQF